MSAREIIKTVRFSEEEWNRYKRLIGWRYHNDWTAVVRNALHDQLDEMDRERAQLPALFKALENDATDIVLTDHESFRLAREQSEQARLAQEQAEAMQAEAERLAQEQAEAERLAQEQAEAERLAQEQAKAKPKAQKPATKKPKAQKPATKKPKAQKPATKKGKTNDTVANSKRRCAGLQKTHDGL